MATASASVFLTNDSDEDVPITLPALPWHKKILIFIYRNYLPLGLIFLVFFGILVPAPGVFFSKYPTHYICIVGLFLHSGIKLRTGEIKDAFRAYKALLLQILIIMFLTPLIGVKLTELLPFGGHNVEKDISRGQHNRTNVTQSSSNRSHVDTQVYSILGPEAFRTGIQMYFIVPCTISAGVVLVGQAGGNAALALMTTVICNLMAVFCVPLMIKWLMSFEGVKIDIVKLLTKLILTLLLPLLVGKALRFIPRVRLFVKQNSNILKTISVTLLLMIPWMKVSLSSHHDAFKDINIGGAFAILAYGLALHLIFMIFNYGFSVLLRLEVPETKAFVILASQKSLIVAVTVISLLPFDGAFQGLVTLPIIIMHLGVLVVDAFIVTYWHNRTERKDKLNAEMVEENNYELCQTESNNQTSTVTSVCISTV